MTNEKPQISEDYYQVLVRNYPILDYFKYLHLSTHLQKVSAPFAELALNFAQTLPQNPETSAGLRKLLEAKDCFVRAALTK